MANVTTPSVALNVYQMAMLRTPPAIISKRMVANLEKMPWWRADVSTAYNGQSFLDVDRAGVLSGSVLLDEIPVPSAEIYLFYLPDMLLIRTGKTDKNGNFSFDGLDRSTNRYVAVARIPPHNAMIFDTLTPA